MGTAGPAGTLSGIWDHNRSEGTHPPELQRHEHRRFWRQGSARGAGGAVRTTGNRYPEGGMFFDKKHQSCSEPWNYTIAKTPPTSRAFPRPRGQRLLAETNTHTDRTRAATETPKETSSQSQRLRKAGHPTPKLGVRVCLRAGRAVPIPAPHTHTYITAFL